MKKGNQPGSKGTISTHEMRFEFARVLRAVEAGRSLTLTYRNKPLARIIPLRQQPNLSSSDPVFRLHELAEPVGPLTTPRLMRRFIAAEVLFRIPVLFSLSSTAVTVATGSLKMMKIVQQPSCVASNAAPCYGLTWSDPFRFSLFTIQPGFL